MILTRDEIVYLLELIREKEGMGYSKDPRVGPLQAKLSVMLDMAPGEPRKKT